MKSQEKQKNIGTIFTDKGFTNSIYMQQYDLEGQIYILGYMLRKEKWKIENNKIIFPDVKSETQIKKIVKMNELDLKDFYFDIRAEEIDRCRMVGIDSQAQYIKTQKIKIERQKQALDNSQELQNDDIEMEVE